MTWLWVILAALIGLIAGIVIMYIATNRRTRKVPSLTKYVAFSIAILIAYTIAELVLVAVGGASHDTLTTCVYACFGGEILSCALIKIFKLKEENKENE